MAMWLLKTEPSQYSFDELARAGETVWDGVKNPVALRNLKAMRRGDRVVVYHTGDEKAVVGTAEVVREAYPDPKSRKAWMLVVDVRAGERLAKPVTLAEIKALALFAGSPLVRQPRLSVVPLSAEQWTQLTGSAP
jgi:predicted RNA-binding protein with PUA-like domain